MKNILSKILNWVNQIGFDLLLNRIIKILIIIFLIMIITQLLFDDYIGDIGIRFMNDLDSNNTNYY